MTSQNPKPEADKSASTPFDQTYKESFSKPEMVENLLRGYGPKDLVKFFDFSTLEDFPTEKIGAFGEEHRNDKLWKCKFENRDSFILIMLEFQSSNDKFMSLRIRTYIDGIWSYLVRHGLLQTSNLPLFFPILLYNGQYRWTAPMTIDELLGEIPEELRLYQHGKYHLVDIGRLPQDLVDADKSSLSTLMKLERAKTLDDAEQVGKLLRLLLQDPKTSREAHIWLHYMYDLAKKNEVYAQLDLSSIRGGNETMLEANLTLIFEDMQRISKEAEEKVAKANRMTAEANKRTEEANILTAKAHKLSEEANKKADDAIKKITEGVRNLLALGGLSLEQIAQVFNMSIDEVLAIKSGMTCR